MSWDGKKNICVDFDGVIHLYVSGWKALDIIEDDPHPEAFEYLKSYLERFHVYIYSARSATDEGIAAMKAWFEKHNMDPEILGKLKFCTTKPAASVYIDDRGWLFTGKWPTAEELDSFQPWNKKTS